MRSGYTDDCDDNWARIMWRGAVCAAIDGKRGQAFLREMLAALDALPEKRLIAGELVSEHGCCALGAVAIARKCSVDAVDVTDNAAVGDVFGIAPTLAAEIAYQNDEIVTRKGATGEEERFSTVRAWVAKNITAEPGGKR